VAGKPSPGGGLETGGTMARCRRGLSGGDDLPYRKPPAPSMATVQSCLDQKSRAVHALSPRHQVRDALQLMHEHRIRSVMVMDGNVLAGIVSERDCALKVLLPGLDANNTPLSAVMTAAPVTVAPQDSLDHCMREMTTRSIRHLPVLSGGAVVGMISIGDIVKDIMRQQEQHIRYLETYIKGHSGSY
jgi:CBS domain-containing protein